MKTESRFETIYLADRKVLVDKEAIIKGDDCRCYKNTLAGNVISNEPISEKELNLVNIATNVFKVIAANPQLGTLPLLPEMELDEIAFANQINTQGEHKLPYNEGRWYGRIEGFKAAKELYPFSKQDMIEFLKWIVEKQWENERLLNLIRHRDFVSIFELYLDQRQKPQFIPEMVCKYCNDTGWVNGDERCSCERNWDKGISELQPKIDKTTNTLIGKWK